MQTISTLIFTILLEKSRKWSLVKVWMFFCFLNGTLHVKSRKGQYNFNLCNDGNPKYFFKAKCDWLLSSRWFIKTLLPDILCHLLEGLLLTWDLDLSEWIRVVGTRFDISYLTSTRNTFFLTRLFKWKAGSALLARQPWIGFYFSSIWMFFSLSRRFLM